MEQASPPEASPKKRSVLASIKALVLTLAVLACLWFGLRYVLTPLVFAKPVLPVQTGGIAQNDARIQALEERIAALEIAPPPAPAMIDAASLEARLTALENAAAVPRASENTIDNEELTALKLEIASLKADNHKALQTLLAASHLAMALREGRPFSVELRDYLAIQPEKKEVFAPLEPAAVIGVATLAQLQTQFASAIRNATSSASQDKSLAGSLKSLIKVRKTGEAHTGTDDASIFARAEAKLARGDIVGSLKETLALSNPAAQTMKDWQARAREYLAAHEAIQALQ